jgi:hypothetical protein
MLLSYTKHGHLVDNLEIKKKKLKQFWIIFFEKSQPPPFPVKWSVPNKCDNDETGHKSHDLGNTEPTSLPTKQRNIL